MSHAPRKAAPPATRELLREAGLRATGARLEVLRCLEEASRPLSHAEVVAALGDGPADPATVYRNLVALVEAGLVRRADLGDRIWRYERAEAGAHREHPHFTCTECGAVACLPEGCVKVAADPALPRRRGAAGLQIQLSGRCDRCG